MNPLRVVCGALVREGRVMAARRGPAMRHAGRWELPGGKVEPGEDDATALARELREELGMRVRVGAPLGEARTPSGTGTLLLVAYAVTTTDEPTLGEHDALAWLGPADLATVAWADGDVPLIGALEAHLRALARAG